MSEISILIGTTKGAFVLSGDAAGGEWRLGGPWCGGWPINHVVGDAETGRIWAGGGNGFTGAGVWRSENGTDWTRSQLANGQMAAMVAEDPDLAAFLKWEPQDTPFDGEVEAIWSLLYAHGTLWAGGLPGKLYRSGDGGETWESVEAINTHPERETWNPGAAGLVAHTLVPHPHDRGKLWLGISAAGVFATEDGGETFERRNRLSNADGCAEHHHPAAPRDGLTGFCVHNMVRAPGGTGDLLYQQNHHGVFRSRDGGRHWDDVTEGLPSTFGFPIAVHPHDPEVIWTLPLNGDAEGRYPPDAAAAIWKSVDGGETWRACREGLPQENCFFTVLRQAMATDRQRQAGLAFGTNTGSVFYSRDEGESWDEIARHLPTVLSVEIMDRR